MPAIMLLIGVSTVLVIFMGGLMLIVLRKRSLESRPCTSVSSKT